MTAKQPNLFDVQVDRHGRMRVEPHRFDGATFDSKLDQARLDTQLGRVFDLMSDGHWRTLFGICERIGCGSEAGISARLRDLRKKRFGGHAVYRRHRGPAANGLYEYRLIPREKGT